MISPFSVNLENATVPIKDRTASNNITSKKKTVSKSMDISPISVISPTPIASNAITRSGVDGPLLDDKQRLG